jgi:hypothetical protein
MTDIKKIEVPQPNSSNVNVALRRLAEAVNLLSGVTDQDQRAVRVFEMNQRIDAMEDRLKAAGL